MSELSHRTYLLLSHTFVIIIFVIVFAFVIVALTVVDFIVDVVLVHVGGVGGTVYVDEIKV